MMKQESSNITTIHETFYVKFLFEINDVSCENIK